MTGLTQRWSQSMMDNYGQPELGLVRGEGAVVWDENGKSYLDFLGGIAVNVLGHAHPAIVEALRRQVATLGHVSNYFVAEPTVALAEALLARAGRPGRLRNLAPRQRGRVRVSWLTARTEVVHHRRLPRPHDGGARAHRPTGQVRSVPAAAWRRHHVPYGDPTRWSTRSTTDRDGLEPIQARTG
jgi:acetylornithine aminotransferase